jgi:hypothetical protein
MGFVSSMKRFIPAILFCLVPLVALADGGADFIKATRKGDLTKMKAMLDAGQSIDFQTEKYMETALMHAADSGQPEAVKLLLQRGASINTVNYQGRTALFFSVYNYSPQIARELLNHNADPNIADKYGDTPLTIVVFQDPKLTRILLDGGANPNVMGRKGLTPLMRAAWFGQRESLDMLLEHKDQDINATNADGETAYVKAGQRGLAEFMDDLRAHGATEKPLFLGKPLGADKSLTPAQLWALAVPAILVQINGECHETLDVYPPDYPGTHNKDAQDHLLDWWGIHDRAELERTLGWLLTEGHRNEYRKLVADKELQSQHAKDYFSAFFHSASQPEAANKPTGESNQFLAWDLCRLIFLARTGYAAGYLSKENAWPLIMSVAQTLQRAFKSWDELGADYLAGRKIWTGRIHGDQHNQNFDPARYQAVYGLLVNKEDKNSPWTKNPWETSLGEPVSAPPPWVQPKGNDIGKN